MKRRTRGRIPACRRGSTWLACPGAAAGGVRAGGGGGVRAEGVRRGGEAGREARDRGCGSDDTDTAEATLTIPITRRPRRRRPCRPRRHRSHPRRRRRLRPAAPPCTPACAAGGRPRWPPPFPTVEGGVGRGGRGARVAATLPTVAHPTLPPSPLPAHASWARVSSSSHALATARPRGVLELKESLGPPGTWDGRRGGGGRGGNGRRHALAARRGPASERSPPAHDPHKRAVSLLPAW